MQSINDNKIWLRVLFQFTAPTKISDFKSQPYTLTTYFEILN